MTTIKFLKQFGLTEREADVYLDLSQFPNSTVVQISKRTSYARSSIYQILESLIHKGMVISLKENKSKKYSIIDPENIKNKIVEEKKKLDILSEGVDDIVKTIKESKGEETNVKVYKGDEGIKQLLWNILSCKSKLLVGFSPSTLECITDREFSEKWREEFKVRGLKNKNLLNKYQPLTWTDVPGFLEEHVEIRTLEEKKIKFEHEVFIYDNTLSIVSKKDIPDQYGLEIKDKLLANAYRQLFEFIWNEVGELKEMPQKQKSC